MADRPRESLDDPEYAAFAWRRFRRMLGWSVLASAAMAAGAILWLEQAYGPLGWFAVLATIGGICGTILTAGALMGLVFLSSGTGHDEAVEQAGHDERWR